VVEIVAPRTAQSSGTERTDRRVKYEEYAQAGVLEYWIVDTVVRTVEVHTLRDGAYLILGKWGTDGVIRSGLLPELSLAVSSLFEG